MLRINLLDTKGSPRLVLNQPAAVSDNTAIDMWLAVFAAVSNCTDDTIEVRFKMARGPMATGFVNGKFRRIEINNDNDFQMYLTAVDIIPDSVSLIR